MNTPHPIDKIVDTKVGGDGEIYYQVKWVETWERATDLEKFPDVIGQFWEFVKQAQIVSHVAEKRRRLSQTAQSRLSELLQKPNKFSEKILGGTQQSVSLVTAGGGIASGPIVHNLKAEIDTGNEDCLSNLASNLTTINNLNGESSSMLVTAPSEELVVQLTNKDDLQDNNYSIVHQDEDIICVLPDNMEYDASSAGNGLEEQTKQDQSDKNRTVLDTEDRDSLFDSPSSMDDRSTLSEDDARPFMSNCDDDQLPSMQSRDDNSLQSMLTSDDYSLPSMITQNDSSLPSMLTRDDDSLRSMLTPTRKYVRQKPKSAGKMPEWRENFQIVESFDTEMRVTKVQFQCKMCLKFMSNWNHAHRHYKIHTGALKVLCPICSETFSRKDHLNSHIRARHKDYT